MQISYELTKDPKLLEEYYQVRGRCYQQELKLSSQTKHTRRAARATGERATGSC